MHEASAGNPFYALELGRAAETATGEPPPVPEPLRDLVLARLETLPRPTRDALAAAAALARPTVGLVARAGGGEDVLQPALAAQVLELDGERIRFSHPLLASGAYERLDGLGRRQPHRRLAGLVEHEEERWRHLALATPALTRRSPLASSTPPAMPACAARAPRPPICASWPSG